MRRVSTSFVVHCGSCVCPAYEVLSDPEKRRHYDQFGSSDQSQDHYQKHSFDFDAFFHGQSSGDNGFFDFNFDDMFKDDMFGGDFFEFGHHSNEGGKC